MAEKIKGITIEIDGNVKPFKKAVQSLNTTTNKLKTELKGVTSLLKMDPGNVTLIKQKQDLLNKSVEETRTKLKKLQQAESETSQAMQNGEEINQEEYRNLQREIVSTEQKLKSLEAEAKSFGSNANAQLLAVSGSMQAFGNKAKAAGQSLRTMSLVATGALTAATSVTMDFEEAMSQVQATLGETDATSKSMLKLRDAAQTMGVALGYSASEVAEGLNYMALAGYDAEKAVEVLPSVLQLAAAGSMDLADASDMVTDALTALGLSTSYADTFADQLAKTASKSNTSVAQLGEAILTVGGTAKTMAGGTTELNTALGILADNSIKGSEGGTKLRNILLALEAPTNSAQAALDNLGVSAYDAEGEMRPLQDIIGDLNTAMDGMTTSERQNIISSIFNKRDLAAVEALLGTTTERWEQLSNAIDDSSGASLLMAATQIDNLSGAIDVMKASLESAGITIGEYITPALTKIAKAMATLATKFSETPQAVKGLVTVLLTLAAAAAPVLIIIGQVSLGLSAITREAAKIGTSDSGIRSLTTRLRGLGASITQVIERLKALDVSKVTAAASSVMLSAQLAIENVAVKLSETRFASGAKKVLAFAAAHKGALAASLGLIGGLVALGVYMSQTGKTGDEVAADITRLADTIASYINSFSQELPQIIAQIMPALTAMINAFVAAIPVLMPAIIDAGVQLLLGLVYSIDQILGPLVKALPQIITSITYALITMAPSIIACGVELFKALISAIPQVIPELVAALPQIIYAIVEGLIAIGAALISCGVQLLQMLWKGIKSWSSSLGSNVLALAKSIPSKIKAGLGSLTSIGQDFIAGLWNGIKAKFADTLTKVEGLVKLLPNTVKKLLGIASPSKVMAEIGQWIPLGLAQGIEGKTQALLASARSQVAVLENQYSGAGVMASSGDLAGGGTTINQTVNINQPVSTPIETARALRRQAGLGLAGV